jgi:hypothetical protein
MLSRLAVHHPGHDQLSGFAIFPIRNTKCVEIENQFRCAFLDVFIQILDGSVEDRCGYLRALLFLGTLFIKNKRINLAAND